MDKALFRFSDGKAASVSAPARSRGSFSEAFGRFRRNRASLTAAVIIALLLIFALSVPLFSAYDVGFRDGYYRSLPPIFARTVTVTGTQAVRDYYGAADAVRAVAAQERNAHSGAWNYTLRVDAYARVGYVYVDMSAAEFAALQRYQNETGEQVCYPVAKNYATFYPAVKSSANLWYELKDDGPYSTGEAARHDETGAPIYTPNYLTGESDYHSVRLDGDPGNWIYGVQNQTGYRCRVHYSAYYRYQNGVAPRFFLGTNQHGQDIMTCLASGARLSFGLSVGVSILNLLIGLLYGAVEGYYGGKVDLAMERVADVLAAIPFIVVATLFRLYLAQRLGAVVTLLFAFVLTGWIGIAARVRSQFYRVKGEQYVLCARTLGARDRRIIFRHILPNALGTIITSCILLIPGVIFSESMLSYLGIIDLEASNLTSIGTMLANGRAHLGTYPHILAAPAIFIALLEISFNLLGNGLRDAFDPSLRGT